MASEEPKEPDSPQRPKRRERKHPDLQRYQPLTGHRHGDGESSQTELLGAEQLSPIKTKPVCERLPETRLRTPETRLLPGRVSISRQRADARLGGDDGRSSSSLDFGLFQSKMDARYDKDVDDDDKQPGGETKTKKIRKPDREIYQPGLRRNIQIKDVNVGRELDRIPPIFPDHDRKSLCSARGMKLKPDGKEKPRRRFEGLEPGQSTELELPPLDRSVLKLPSKLENLNLREWDRFGSAGRSVEHMKDEEKGGRRKERGSAKKKSEREKERSLLSGGDDESLQVKPKKDKKPESRGDPARKRQDSRKGDKPYERLVMPQIRVGEHDGSETSLTVQHYTESDLRHLRNRTFSSSSESSDELGKKPEPGAATWSRLPPARRDTLTRGEKRRGHVKTRRSSSDSPEENPTVNRPGTRRRRRKKKGGDVEPGNERGEGRPFTRGDERGAFRLPKEKPSDRPSYLGEGQSRRRSSGASGKNGGLLVLPAARPDAPSSPEAGQKLSLGGLRGAPLLKSRSNRGELRRLWDPNDPEQKARSQSSTSPNQKPSLQSQAGSACGPLHFMDTDDEQGVGLPVQKDEDVRESKQAKTHYKFQKSDNPYRQPVTASSPQATVSGQRLLPCPGSYSLTSPNLSSSIGNNKSLGYPQLVIGSSLTLDEDELQTRREMSRNLRAADVNEAQLSNLLSRERISADGLDRMTELRAELLELYEQVILTDIEFAESQNVDQALWKNVFYQVIERFRQLLKDPNNDNSHHIKNLLLTLLDEGAIFFENLIQRLQSSYHFSVEDYMDGLGGRTRPLRKMVKTVKVKYALISAHRCMINQGDIARYREQACDGTNYGKARSWYLKAQQIAPKNGRPYNQLALLAVYTKRKLDAVYFYMRSLAASNPILTAKESLMSLFEETKRKVEQLEILKKQEQDEACAGPEQRKSATGSKEKDGSRMEIWIRPCADRLSGSMHRGWSGSSRESEMADELRGVTLSELSKRLVLNFLHAHGKLFTKVGMDTFPEVASEVLEDLQRLLQYNASMLGSTNMIQMITMNMFAIYHAQRRGEEEGEDSSVLLEQSSALGIGMFAVLVHRCAELIRHLPTENLVVSNDEETEEKKIAKVSSFPMDLREILPSIKIWSDWMLGHPEQLTAPQCHLKGCLNVWESLADLCNALACVNHEEVVLYKMDSEECERDEQLVFLVLKEDRQLSGFVPLLSAPLEMCYMEICADRGIASDCKRITVIKYFLEALCGQEEPMVVFKEGKYISLAKPVPNSLEVAESMDESLLEKEMEDLALALEAGASLAGDEAGSAAAGNTEGDIEELKVRHNALTHKLAQQQKRRDKIQAVLQTNAQLQLEVRPVFLIPDTNGFIDHLPAVKRLLQCGTYIIVVPLIVITELDGLARGMDIGAKAIGIDNTVSRHHNVNIIHARAVQERARVAVAYLEKRFELREPCLRAMTSRGTVLDSIALRNEDNSGLLGNNDDVILSCCLQYCREVPTEPEAAPKRVTRLLREVVLLTDDRNLRVKALTHNVPVRDIPTFLTWAKVG